MMTAAKWKTTISVMVGLIIVLLLLCACQKENENSITPTQSTHINSQLILTDNVWEDGVSLNTSCYYVDSTRMLLALNREERKSVGSSDIKYETEQFITYNTVENQVEHIIPLYNNSPVNSAIIHQGKVIYVSYKPKNNKIKWHIIERMDSQEHKIAEGYCESGYDLHALALCGEKPIVLWKDITNNRSGFSVVQENSLRDIFSAEYDWIVDTNMSTNGKEFCFPIYDSKRSKLAIADISGILEKVELDGKITSFAITKDNLLCGLGDYGETDKFHLLNYNFRTGDVKSKSVNEAIYRLQGSDSDYALYVNYQFRIFQINAKKGNEKELYPPVGYYNKPVFFQTGSANFVIAEFLVDNKHEYYKLSISE